MKELFDISHHLHRYSQCSEELEIKIVLNRLPNLTKSVCEFGMDGKHLSNTFFLCEFHGFRGVYIEQNVERFNRIPPLENVVKYNTKILNNLDSILSQSFIEKNFDILSIDIDNNDYHVWNTLKKYKPKVVIIEFNPFIPADFKYIYDENRGIFSSSFISMCELAYSKGYMLYKQICGNLFFVDSIYRSSLNLLEFDDIYSGFIPYKKIKNGKRVPVLKNTKLI